MSELSSENLALLPNPERLKQLCKSISALEAIICPEWESRYYSYQKKWSETEEFCEMRNGEGDHLLILFSNAGVCLNGFAHESAMNGWKTTTDSAPKTFFQKMFRSSEKVEELESICENHWPGLFEGLPVIFKEFIFGEPIKSIGTTFCIWRTIYDSAWKKGKVVLPSDDYKDGSARLLHLLDGNPATFKEWAEDYYDESLEENGLSEGLVEKIFAGSTITRDMVLELQPDFEDFNQLKEDLTEIGYPNQL